MRLNEIERALRTVGSFYRMVFDSDMEYSWGPEFEHGPIAACSFQRGIVGGHDYVVRVCTYQPGVAAPALWARSDIWATVYIDGRLARDTELAVANDRWAALLTDFKKRQVRISGEGEPPRELHLATTRGDHFPDS